MSLPTKVLNTHRKSLNLVDIPLSLETKVNSGIFFMLFVFLGLSILSPSGFQPNHMLVLILLP